MARSRIRWEDRELVNKLRTFNARADRALWAVVQFHSPRALAYGRQNAPWRDQTSNARNGLFATAQREPNKYRIIFGHGVPYGIWLEVRWSGRYAIVRPTIDHEGPQVMKTASMLYERMFK